MVILDGVGVNDLVMGGVEPWSVFWSDEEDGAEEEGPFFLADDSSCNLSTSNVSFSFCSSSNIGSYLIHCSLNSSALLARVSPFVLVEGVRLFVYLSVVASRDKDPEASL